MNQNSLIFAPTNVPLSIMISEPVGHVIYSFGFDFANKKLIPEDIENEEFSRLDMCLIRKDFVDQAGTISTLKNIYGLAMGNSGDDQE